MYNHHIYPLSFHVPLLPNIESHNESIGAKVRDHKSTYTQSNTDNTIVIRLLGLKASLYMIKCGKPHMLEEITGLQQGSRGWDY